MREIDRRIKRTLENYIETLRGQKSEWPSDVNMVLECIHTNLFKEELTVTWLLENCHIKNNNFSGKFRFYTGFGLKQYILIKRLEAAKLLLINKKNQQLSVNEIGFEVGFATYASFNRAFNNYFGLPPVRWLKKNQGKM